MRTRSSPVIVYALAMLAGLYFGAAPAQAADPPPSGEQVLAVMLGEIGANDFRLSDMGPDGNTGYEALNPAVAYNSANNQYLVVWHGDDNTAPLVDNEEEIFGQRVDAATGAEIGGDFRVSTMGPAGNVNYGGYYAAVAYNSTNNEYLVVWYGDDNGNGLVLNEYEIFGQRINAATGALLGSRFRISDMGADGNSAYDAIYPAVAYNSMNNEYLVAWYGDDNTAPLVNDEYEIFGQRLNAATGAQMGGDFRLSDMGPNGNVNYGAFHPAIAYNSTNNEYLVVWYGDDNTALLVDEEYEIFGQRLNAATGMEVGLNDFLISFMGPLSNPSFDARNPSITYNNINNEYLVVWQGDKDFSGLVDDEDEIFGQRINAATGSSVGVTSFRLSEMGGTGDPDFDALNPGVAYNSAMNHYLVTWHGEDNTAGLVLGEYEIYGQPVDAATGARIGQHIRLSDMGPDGDNNFNGINPVVTYNSANNEYFTTWDGEDNINGLVNNESEIFGQRLKAGALVYLPVLIK